MAHELVRATLLSTALTRLLEEVDFSRLEPAHKAELRQLGSERVEGQAGEGTRRQLGGLDAVRELGAWFGETLLELAPFLALLQADDVAEIFVNGPSQVWVERHGRTEQAPIAFSSDDVLRQLAQWLSAAAGQPVHTGRPSVKGCLPDGSRLTALVAPRAADGTVLTLRRPRLVGADLSQLAAGGGLPHPLPALLEAMVASRLNLLISGHCGSGRSTLLGALARAVPPGERLATIEESSQLRLDRDQVLRLETGPEASSEQTAELLRTAARMRPSRLVLDELRGAEAVELLAAMSTGFAGSMATIAAGSPTDALDRLELGLALAQPGLQPQHLKYTISRAVDAIVHLEHPASGRRRVQSISEVQRSRDGTLVTQPLFRGRELLRSAPPSPVGARHAGGTRPSFAERLERRGFRFSQELWGLRTSVA